MNYTLWSRYFHIFWGSQFWDGKGNKTVLRKSQAFKRWSKKLSHIWICPSGITSFVKKDTCPSSEHYAPITFVFLFNNIFCILLMWHNKTEAIDKSKVRCVKQFKKIFKKICNLILRNNIRYMTMFKLRRFSMIWERPVSYIK